MADRIGTINAALGAIGATPLGAETAPGGAKLVTIYDRAIGALCSSYPWTFQRRITRLVQLTTPPVSRYAYGFACPSDLDGSPLALYTSVDAEQRRMPPVVDFEFAENVVFSDEPVLWMRYVRLPNPALWPSYFYNLAVMALAVEFAIPVREDAALHDRLHDRVYGTTAMMGEGGMLGQAKAVNSSGNASASIQIGSNPLIACRRS